MVKNRNDIIVISLLLFFIIGIIWSVKDFVGITVKNSTDTEEFSHYLEKVTYSADYMPSVENMGNYTTFQVKYKKTALIFEKYTVGVYLTYDESEFENQYNYIMENYEFFDENSKNRDGVDCFAKTRGYEIRMVDLEYPLQTYRTALLIGIDKENKKICYLYYYDFDLEVLDDLYEYVNLYFSF